MIWEIPELKAFYNLGQNIRRLFHFLAKFVFTTSETELDYYHQKVSALFRKFPENP